MAKAVKSELSGGSIAGMISLLEGEATNTDNLISSINSFINDSTSTLVGESYNAVRQKLGYICKMFKHVRRFRQN